MTTFRIVVEVDPKRAIAGTQKVEKGLKRVGQQADRTRALIGRAFGAAALGAGITAGIRLMANFSQEMSTVQGITGATATQFKALSDEAQRLGSTTRFSASQAAEGMKFLSRAGFSVDEVLQSTGDTLLLAQAGALDLGRAADISSNVLTAFGLKAGEMGRVVDVMASAANSANTDVEQLGQGMKFVAPVAAGLGVSLEETTAAMGKLSDAGLQSTMAGTGLRKIMSTLEAPSKAARDILAEVGLTANDVKVSQVGLTGAMEALAKAGLDTGQSLQLFGERGGPAFAVLKDAIPGVKELTTQLQNSEGTAKRMADVMDDNLNGALLSVKSAIEGFVLALGETSGAASGLQALFTGLADGIRFLTANMETVIQVGEAVAIMFGVRLAAQAIPAVIGAIRLLTAAMATNPIGLLAVAATKLIPILVTLGAGLLAFGDKFPAVQALVDALGAAWDTLVQLFTGGMDTMSTEAIDWGNVMETVSSVITKALTFVVDMVDTTVAVFVAGKQGIINAWVGIGPGLRNLIREALNGAIQLAEDGVNNIIAKFSAVKEFFGGAAVDPVTFGENLQFKLEKNPASENPGIIDAFNQQRGQISQAFQGNTEKIAAAREEKVVVEELTNQYAAYGAGQVKAKEAVDQLTAATTKEVEAVQTATPALEQAATATKGVGSAAKTATDEVGKLAEKVEEKASFIGDALKGAFQIGADAMKEFIKTGKFDFDKFVSDIMSKITDLAFNSLFQGGGQGGGGGLGGILSGLFGGGSGGGGGGLGSLFGFANGGSFDLGGRPGHDRNVLSLNDRPIARVSKGERIGISPNGGGGGGTSVVMNISTPNAESFERSQGQIQARVIAGLNRAGTRNN